MNKITKSLIIILFMIISLPMTHLSAQVSTWDGTWEPWTHGTGTEYDPFLIENAQQLAYLAYRVNNGLDAGGGHVSNHDYHYKLMVDIDLNGSEDFQWTPIGYWSSDTDYQCFGGFFDGNNHTITKLYINSSDNRIGLFGFTDGVTIGNINITQSTIITNNYAAGGIVGCNIGTTSLMNCNNISGLLSSDDSAGGIIGSSIHNSAITIRNCWNNSNVTSQKQAGGIIGIIYGGNGTVDCCFNNGVVTVSGSKTWLGVGGIVGFTYSGTYIYVTNCYNTGSIATVDNGATQYTAGIIGRNTGCYDFITNCYNIGNVTIAGNGSTGGIVAYSQGGSLTVNNCYYLNTCGGYGDGEPKTEVYMKSSEFIEVLNDGTDVWIMDSYNVNQGYPIFSDMPYIRIITTDATNISNTHATLNGEAFSTETITFQGFEYRKTSETNYQSVYVSSSGEMSETLSGLTPGTQYTYRTFCVVDGVGTIYGNNQPFTTLAISVTTTNATNITQTHATLNGNIDFGDANISAKGFEYKKTSEETWQTISVTGSGDISTTLSNLTPNTQYHFHVFCTPQDCETVYGQEKTFMTENVSVTTYDATNLTESSATLNGFIDAGDAEVLGRGFKYCPDNNWNNATTVSVANSGNISATITNLAQGIYAYRAFVSLNDETYLGDIMTFELSWLNNDTIYINDAEKLRWVAEQCNSGTTFEGKYIKLVNNIVLPLNVPNNMISIGSYPDHPFKGTFDGNGMLISNLYIDQPNTPYQGFFGYTLNANLYNVGLVNISASGRNYTGGMVAYAESTHLRDCYVNGGTLYALSYCGGLVGYQEQGTNSIISGCYNTCTVSGNHYVGGLLGYSNYGTVRNSYVAAPVTGLGTGVGGIIGGANEVLMYNCYFNTEITGQTEAIGENNFKGGEGMTSAQMRNPQFVATMNQGLVSPVWKADYSHNINNGFPILIWQYDNIGVDEINDISNHLMLYPNPANSFVMIQVEDENVCFRQISVYDISGRMMLSENASGQQHNIDVSTLPKGIYFVRVITTDNNIGNVKLVVQ